MKEDHWAGRTLQDVRLEPAADNSTSSLTVLGLQQGRLYTLLLLPEGQGLPLGAASLTSSLAILPSGAGTESIASPRSTPRPQGVWQWWGRWGCGPPSSGPAS